MYNCNTRTISNWISKLCNKKYIKIEYEKSLNLRKIYVVVKNEIIEENKKKKIENKEKKRSIINDFFDRL